MEVDLAGQACLAAGDRGAQAGQARGVGRGRPGEVGDGQAPCRCGQAGHIDEVLDRDPQPPSWRGLLQDPRGHNRSVWQGGGGRARPRRAVGAARLPSGWQMPFTG
jgi:hypothetical protein